MPQGYPREAEEAEEAEGRGKGEEAEGREHEYLIPSQGGIHSVLLKLAE
jgi:hypothetical protein